MNFWGILFGLFFISIGVGVLFGINVWKYVFPVLLILFGLSIIFRQQSSQPPPFSKPQESKENTIDYAAVFNGIDRRVITNDFQGGKISTVFGGGTVDLSQAKISNKKPINLEVSCVFGGVKLIVPRTWRVESSLTGVFGGFSNNTLYPDKPMGTLILKGAGVFGGGEVTNP